MRFFGRKPKPPLAEAIGLAGQAIAIAYRYKRDRSHMPTEEELGLLDKLASTLWEAHATAEYIARTMHQRAAGEPEGVKKFSGPDMFNYHYPE